MAGSALLLLGSRVDLEFCECGFEVFWVVSSAWNLFPNPAGPKPTQPLLGWLWGSWVREFSLGAFRVDLMSFWSPARSEIHSARGVVSRFFSSGLDVFLVANAARNPFSSCTGSQLDQEHDQSRPRHCWVGFGPVVFGNWFGAGLARVGSLLGRQLGLRSIP